MFTLGIEYFKKWVLKDETLFILRTFTDGQSNNYTGENGSIWFESWSQLVIIFLQPPFLKDPKALYEKQWLKPCCTPLKRPCPGATWQTSTPCLPGHRARQVGKKTGLSFIVILPHERVPQWAWSSTLEDSFRQGGIPENPNSSASSCSSCSTQDILTFFWRTVNSRYERVCSAFQFTSYVNSIPNALASSHWCLLERWCYSSTAFSTWCAAELQQGVRIPWYSCLLDCNIPLSPLTREDSYRLTREHSQRIESATFSLYKV